MNSIKTDLQRIVSDGSDCTDAFIYRALATALLLLLDGQDRAAGRNIPQPLGNAGKSKEHLKVTTPSSGKRYLRLRQVTLKIGVTNDTIYNWIKKGKFPKQTKISERSVAWLEEEIDEWMENNRAQV